MRLVLILASAAALAACTTASETPVASNAPARMESAPVTPVTASALPPISGAPVAQSVTTTSGAGTTMMQRAPGARESAGLSNVSPVSRGGAISGNALSGTIVSGQTASTIPSVIDRNRTLPSRRSTAPTDPLGPGTAPPIVAPELRDTTGNTLRNRQRVDF